MGRLLVSDFGAFVPLSPTALKPFIWLALGDATPPFLLWNMFPLFLDPDANVGPRSEDGETCAKRDA